MPQLVQQFLGSVDPSDIVVLLLSCAFTGVLTAAAIKWQQKQKKLSCEILGRVFLVGMYEEAREKLEIVYEGQRVGGDVYLIVLRVVNTGNVPITADDYEEGLEIDFGAGAQVLVAQVLRAYPVALGDWQAQPVLTEVGNRVEVQPVLLNSGDWFTMQVLVGEFDEGEVELHGRIVGVKEIELVKGRHEGRSIRPIRWRLPLLLLTVVLICISSPLGAVLLVMKLGVSTAAMGVWVLVVIALFASVGLLQLISLPERG
jgi:hypothetical protein